MNRSLHMQGLAMLHKAQQQMYAQCNTCHGIANHHVLRLPWQCVHMCISKLPRAGLSHARMCITCHDIPNIMCNACHDNAYVCVSPAYFTFLQSSCQSLPGPHRSKRHWPPKGWAAILVGPPSQRVICWHWVRSVAGRLPCCQSLLNGPLCRFVSPSLLISDSF